MNIEVRTREIMNSIVSASKDAYHKAEVLPELLALQREIVNFTFSADHANLGNLKIWDVEDHFEHLNEFYDGIASEELLKFKSGSKDFCNLIKAEFSGNKGESKAFRAIDKMRSEHLVLKNVELIGNDCRTEIDAVVITRKGIFIIEVKNTRRDIFIDEKGDYYRIGNFMRLDSNILDKLNTKRQLLNKALIEAGVENTNIFEILVFTNNQIEVQNRCDMIKSCFLAQLPYVIDEWTIGDSCKQIDLYHIFNIIEKARCEEAYPLEFDVYNYKKDFASLMAKLEAASQADEEEISVTNKSETDGGSRSFGLFNKLFSIRNLRIAGGVAAFAGMTITAAISLKNNF